MEHIDDKNKETTENLTQAEIKRARNREYARKRRQENPEKARMSSEKWRKNNPEKNRESQQMAYREAKREAVLERVRDYYTKAKDARQTAVYVCPAFRFMLELKLRKDSAYEMYDGNSPSFVQRAVKGCPALTAMDASLCPMVADVEIAHAQMLAACTMQRVFEISNAWNEVLTQALLLRTQHKK